MELTADILMEKGLDGSRHSEIRCGSDKLTWYFDGKQVAQENTPADMNKPMYMLLSDMTGTSSSWVGQPASGTSTAMQVNWVHVYASNPYANGGTPSGSAASAGTSATAQPAPAAASATAASTTAPVNTLTLHLSEDAWQGNHLGIARYNS